MKLRSQARNSESIRLTFLEFRVLKLSLKEVDILEAPGVFTVGVDVATG